MLKAPFKILESVRFVKRIKVSGILLDFLRFAQISFPTVRVRIQLFEKVPEFRFSHLLLKRNDLNLILLGFVGQGVLGFLGEGYFGH